MDLGLKQKLSFARDRIMENFFCSIGIVPDPEFSPCREKLTQVCCLISTIDDLYDEYGTYDELQLFSNAVERFALTHKLPIDKDAYLNIQCCLLFLPKIIFS